MSTKNDAKDSQSCWGSKPENQGNRRFDRFRKELEITDHLKSIEELCIAYKTNDKKGLNEIDAFQLLKENGPNALTLTPPKSNWWIFLENMIGSFNLLLWAGSVLCLLSSYVQFLNDSEDYTSNLYLGIVLAFVVFISGVFSFYQQYKSDKIMESFKTMIPKRCNVIRDGCQRILPVEQLVVGDLVLVRGGDQVPADIRLTSCQSLKVDNSALTGESEPLLRSTQAEAEAPLEAKNLIFFSTNCLEGTATGFVIRTGDQTAMGQIAALTSGLTHELTPLEVNIQTFIKQISIVAVGCAVVFSIACYLVGFSLISTVIYFITIIVANVPEGLLPTMTVALSLTAKRMANRNCLVKNIQGVETLGSTSTICTDKTGTLTQNKMTVSHIWYNDVIHNAEELFDSQDLTKMFYRWEPFIRVTGNCSKAQFMIGHEHDPVFRRPAFGDPSEVAILRFLEQNIGSVFRYRDQCSVLFEMPFNSTNKFSMCIIKQNKDEEIYALLKGASEAIVKRCNRVLIGNKEVPIDDKFMRRFDQVYGTLGGYGERIIGLCDQKLSNFDNSDKEMNWDDDKIPKEGYRFLGFVTMIDPPRPTVPNAVQDCRMAGIKVIMVTGDHPITAKAVAKMVGIISKETREEMAVRKGLNPKDIKSTEASAVIVTGTQLKTMSDDDLKEILKFDEIIFARTSPQQKLMIVEGCQKLGQIVAVTGDGVNDSPALKRANIGVAMGLIGSDVSKEAADIILLDDNFSTIVTGIEQGRTIFDNLKKSICYTLSSKLPEMMPFLFFVIAGIPLGLSAVTILCIDLGTDLVPSVSLAYESPESDIMRRPPRNIKVEGLIDKNLIFISYLQMGVIETAAGFFNYFLVLALSGFLPTDVINVNEVWYSPSHLVVDSFGQEWPYSQRMLLERSLYSSFFIAVVITKVFAVIACKTRKLSLVQHGMRNNCLNISVLFELLLAAALINVPKLNDSVQMIPIRFTNWFFSMPISILVLVWDEIRRYLIRTFPGGFYEKDLYY